ncbi:MAG: RNA polymerase subunit sigma [Rhizobiales bacterium]|nr:RNA polymerase subunit sigma [Hyphomicrobiales bacterium]|tara:strand:+ start:157 stop:798 length:642 start_codon:yes stop_codon:yes gene_type:complete
MNNPDLIDRLVDDLRPTRGGTPQWMLACAVTAGAIIAAIMMVFWIGLRTDILTAPGTAMFWIKLGYTSVLALLGLAAAMALSRPEKDSWPGLWAVGGVFALTLAGGLWQWGNAPEAVRPVLIFGSTALVCPFFIVAFSAPVLAIMLAVMRRLAPANPTLAGLAAGLASGGAGASVYAFHCGEYGMLFLALWYSVGVGLVALSGALLGRKLLRW